MTSAGTGKTYASAFALREEETKKALFLVHREQIAKQAIASYKKVFGNTRTFGLLSGNSKDFDVDYLFSTMQMMAKQETLSRFHKDEFETIIIDTSTLFSCQYSPDEWGNQLSDEKECYGKLDGIRRRLTTGFTVLIEKA